MSGFAQEDWVPREEHERVVEELRRANRRLSGTLKIVLDTLDSTNVATLFSRVLEEICDAMDAWGTIVYMAEQDGYHLRGVSQSLTGVHIVRFIPFDRAIDSLATHVGHTLRLHVKAPAADALRRGRLDNREVADESTGQVHQVSVEALPPFQSFYAIPVWFGSQVVSLIEVGWRQTHPLSQDDADLLDAVAQYLSVQLVGAFSALRTQREAVLRDASSQIREELLLHANLTEDDVNKALGRAAAELTSVAVPLCEDPRTHRFTAELPHAGRREVPVELSSLAPLSDAVEEGVSAVALAEDSSLVQWLAEVGEPGIVALLDAGKVAGERRACLFLRDLDEEPFDDLDMAFLRMLARDLVSAARGEEARTQERRIS
ncbi:MAG: GAF domain-containing protein, partial [Atopobiaceae bacterium]|nr:GAF domain-containing protein [Atopobiaceae bacterium]